MEPSNLLYKISFAGALFSPFCTMAADKKPNVVFILVDDFGWADVGYNGSTFYETPNIDRLAAESMQFTNGYAAAPVSSPTRCSLMTGKYPARLNITDWIPGYQYGRTTKQLIQYKMIAPTIELNLPLKEVTIAEAMKENGYNTCLVGKWHCCEDSSFYPQYQGFDKNIGGWLKGSPNGDSKEGLAYFTPYHNPYLPDGPKGEYLTDRLGNEAIQWIEQNKEQPFFLYMSFYAVHTPIQPKPEKAAYFREKAKRMGLDVQPTFSTDYKWYNEHPQPAWHWKERLLQNDPNYAALISSMDENIGKILDKLTELGLDENTMVCFLSDNGGLSTAEGSPTCNAPLRGGKGWLYEGGIREPFLIKLPGVTKAGTKCHVPVVSTDFYPTILEACHLPLKPEQHADGVSLLPLLKGKSIDRKAVFWHYPHYGGKGDAPASAIRKGDYKLIEFFETGKIELYNLKKDSSETTDLSTKKPKLAKKMYQELCKWQKEINAQMPQKNPNYKYADSIEVQIDLTDKQQILRGWGVSLSWWAHDVGHKWPENVIDSICYLLTSPQELNMNIFRYNISGGDAPNHNHMRKDAQIPGYKESASADYDWTSDASQRKILLKVNTLRPDAVYEAANYSPPYWMTKSGCSAGDSVGTDNLQDTYYDDFAQYLADCVQYYKEHYGITFSTISPVNEPFSNWWKMNGSQEGCAFSQKNQERIIKALYDILADRNMLKYTSIAAMDANSIDECLVGVEGYKQHGILPYIAQINTHSYAGKQRNELHYFAQQNRLRLWQSESGPLGIKAKGWDNYLLMGQRIITDMRELQPEVWCDWQYAGNGTGGVWALLGYDEKTNQIYRNKGFYCRKHFTHFISSGYRFIRTDSENVLAALSPDGKKMVLELINQTEEPQKIYLQINNKKKKSDFTHFSVSQTTEEYNMRDMGITETTVELPARSITTLVAE